MNTQVTTIDPRTDPRWDTFVERHTKGTFVHTSMWTHVLADTYGYRPRYLAVERSDEIVAGMALVLIRSFLTGNRVVSVPFVDECPPLAEDAEHLRALLAAAIEVQRQDKARYIELRAEYPPDVLANHQLSTHDYYNTFVTDISGDFDELTARFGKRARQYVRNKCLPHLRFHQGTSLDDVKTFYRLNLLTRTKHGMIPQPFVLFHNIWKRVISKGYGFVTVAYRGDEPISANVYFHFKDLLIHKYTGSNTDFAEFRGNHFLVWKGMEYACEHGVKQYDFGRTSPDNKGLVNFKRLWGTREYTLPYYYLPPVEGVTSTTEDSLKYRLMKTFVHHAPGFASRWAGRMVYRHLG